MLSQAREVRSTLVLLTSSVVAAVASWVGAPDRPSTWVAVTATVTAVISAGVAVRQQLLVPARIKAAVRASAAISARLADGEVQRGTAVQFRPGRWLTASYQVEGSTELRLRLGEQWVAAEVVSTHPEINVAVVSCATAHPWVAAPAKAAVDEAAAVRVVTWAQAPRAPRIRVTQDFVVQAPADDSRWLLSGPMPFRGSGGSPVIDVGSGRLVGVLTSVFNGGRELASVFNGGRDELPWLAGALMSDVRQLTQGQA